jgi:hypothetical protein
MPRGPHSKHRQFLSCFILGQPSAPFRDPIAGPLTPAATAVRLRTKSPGHGLAPFLARTKYRRPFPRSPRGMDLLFAALLDWAGKRWLSQLALVLWRSDRGKEPTRFVSCVSSYFCSFWICLLLVLSRDCGSGFAAQGIRGEWMPHRGAVEHLVNNAPLAVSPYPGIKA